MNATSGHVCPKCGYVVRYSGTLCGPVEHLPDGRHKYSLLGGTRLSFAYGK